MINAQETLARLTADQKQRLAALFGRRRGVAWEVGDDELSEMNLVHIRRPERGPATTELNNGGWSVAMLSSEGGA